ncbi:ArnT family glycosyltransferase [Tunturiibacter gelidoferens]|uniref:4-amino-4-deoxy-L-arabinose transferase-like glycosyltransferase n=1 Tax=Tunturiibacter gelidiferens TaxID=3069689 RepID=A0A9X0QE76_9BACT|nr:phospholipid carrier-dependent glycosyltransferase [Edaphobacter lichenicola]MBB5328648.1 4-amino-4-deoxy-L-arabinose transferase-like glycosyltransferase [Edaphobacter lichenicola]
MSWDEGHHLFDGYTILKHRDFGLNPEVPPLAKAAAALPLLPLRLYEPEQHGRSSQLEAFLDGKDFLFKNDANGLLLRGRVVISLFALGLALLVFLAGQEIFGATTGLLALAFLVVDPTLLAHGALVTTDAAITFFVFAAVYAWYRYMGRPTVWKLFLTGVVMGLAWAAKFTGLFLIPALGLMVLVEWFERPSLRLVWKRCVGLAIAVCVAFAVLWGCYGFRYAARPNGMVQNPDLASYLQDYAHVANPKPLRILARTHVLPEAYIWGLANTKLTEERDISYLFGTLRRHGTWLYFPAAILIKSTLPFLVLLVVAVFVCFREPGVRWRWLLLMIPVVVFLGLAINSDMNIGVRHILPIYPFLYLVGASALSVLISRDRRWIAVAGVLLVFQIVTSLRSFPGYIAYANEAWGGQRNVHRWLSDSNSDWGQQLKTASDYLRDRHVTECWMAYTASGVADERYYGVPCKPLPTVVNLWWIPVPMDVPIEIDGPVLISDDELEGVDLQFGQPNPYAQFKALKPTAILDGGLLVYDGHFDVHAASSLVDMARPKKTGTKQESVQ